MNEKQKAVDSLLRAYKREVINFPYLKTDEEKKKSEEKITEINEVILSLSKEIVV